MTTLKATTLDMTTLDTTTMDTPAGPLTVLAARGTVVAAGFGVDAGALAPPGASLRRKPELGPISVAVAAYLAGDLTALDEVPVAAPALGPVTLAAWRALRDIKPGTPVTYTALATAAGHPAAVRTAASACARNPAALFVPCHRVVRADGGLGGYRWGLPVKRWLLDHERRAM